MAFSHKSWITSASCFKSSVRSNRDRENNSGINRVSSQHVNVKSFSFFKRFTANCLKSPNKVDYATPLNMSSQIFMPVSERSPKPYRADDKMRPNSCKTFSANELPNIGVCEKNGERSSYIVYYKSEKIAQTFLKDTRIKRKVKAVTNSKGSNPNLTVSKSDVFLYQGLDGFKNSFPQERTVKKPPKVVSPIKDASEKLVEPSKKSPVEPSPIPVSCDMLVTFLQPGKSGVVVDCRTFVVYNNNHIMGALNVSCSDCITRKRLLCGRIQVVDLVSGPTDAKERFRESLLDNSIELILYDEDTRDLASLPLTHPLKVVSSSLAKVKRKVCYLKGGMKEFHRLHGSLCLQVTVPPRSDSIAFSPTAQIVEDNIDSATISEVLPFLYIGNERDSTNEELLAKCGITHVINVTSHLPMPLGSVKYKRLPASDSSSQNLKQYFDEAMSFIDEARQSDGKVLIHCQAGVSRSATVAMAYIMTKYSMSMMQAFRMVKKHRPIIAPNFNFLGQLLELEANLGVSDGSTGEGLNGVSGELEERVRDLLLHSNGAGEEEEEGKSEVSKFFDISS